MKTKQTIRSMFSVGRSLFHAEYSVPKTLLHLPTAILILPLLLLAAVSTTFATERYVDVGSTNATPPYTNWVTAATTIQDAVDAAVAGDEVVVTNGLYATGGRGVAGTMTNRVAVTKAVTVRSVNGPQVTVIRGAKAAGGGNGDGAIRCVYLTNGASLFGFTLTNGATRTAGDYTKERNGGGVWSESASAVVSNCVITGNSAYYAGGGACSGTLTGCVLSNNAATGLSSWPYLDGMGGGVYYGTLNNCLVSSNWAGFGGGAHQCTLNNCTLRTNRAVYGSDMFSGCGGGANGGTLNNCTLIGNSADIAGGGAMGGTLNNCTLTGNVGGDGGSGGAFWSTLNNCIVYYNTLGMGSDETTNYGGGTLNYCCTRPQPATGTGNITNTPLFVSYGGGNLRLQSTSPCINSGRNAYITNSTDLDGNGRIVSGTVDMGAYEYQGSGSVISYAWLQRYGLATDGSADYLDSDAEGMNNWQEWRCLTDPTNALSVLRLLSASPVGTNVTVSWQSVAGVNYLLERSADLVSPPVFTPLATNLPGQPGTTSYADTNAASLSPLFYRVGVP